MMRLRSPRRLDSTCRAPSDGSRRFTRFACNAQPVVGGVNCCEVVKRDLRPLSSRGADFGLLLHLSPDPAIRARLAALPRRDVSFNFLGRVDGGRVADGSSSAVNLTSAPEQPGHDHDPAGQRHYLLEVVARVSEGELVIDWIHPGKVFGREMTEAQAGAMVRSLTDLLATPAAAAATPADFPLVRLTQDELDAVLVANPDIESVLPPSPVQEGLLFHALDDDRPGVYVQQITAVLEGSVDAPAFEAAWDATIRRHDALRTSFHRSQLDGHPFSVVHRKLRCPVEWLDWTGTGAAEIESRWDILLRADRLRGFQLDRAPLMRVHVARVGSAGGVYCGLIIICSSMVGRYPSRWAMSSPIIVPGQRARPRLDYPQAPTPATWPGGPVGTRAPPRRAGGKSCAGSTRQARCSCRPPPRRSRQKFPRIPMTRSSSRCRRR